VNDPIHVAPVDPDHRCSTRLGLQGHQAKRLLHAGCTNKSAARYIDASI
jgi:hypothetical protein